MSDNNLIFLHIPKTGGTSIHANIDENKAKTGLQNVGVDILPHNYNLYDIPQGMGTPAMIVRNPEDRFKSSFYFAKKGGFRENDEPNGKTFDENFKDHKIQEFDNPDQLLRGLQRGDDTAIQAIFSKQEGQPRDTANVIYWPQTTWLTPKKNQKVPDNYDTNVKLICFDKLNDDYKKLINDNDNMPIKDLPFENKSPNKEKKSSLSSDSVDFLKRTYVGDYILYDMACNNNVSEIDYSVIKGIPYFKYSPFLASGDLM